MQGIKWRALEALGLSGESLSGELRVAMQGNRTLSVAGVQSVKRYTPDSLRVQVIGGMVTVEGFELMLRAIATGVVEVCGRIDAISFEMGDQESQP
jgi:sporulation protein YqfC